MEKISNTILSLWKKILMIDDITLSDDFFSIGGNSLLAAELLQHIKTISL